VPETTIVVPRGPDVGEMEIEAFAVGGAVIVVSVGVADAEAEPDGVALADLPGRAERAFVGVAETANEGVAGAVAAG
jgi:hypothetical protein